MREYNPDELAAIRADGVLMDRVGGRAPVVALFAGVLMSAAAARAVDDALALHELEGVTNA